MAITKISELNKEHINTLGNSLTFFKGTFWIMPFELVVTGPQRDVTEGLTLYNNKVLYVLVNFESTDDKMKVRSIIINNDGSAEGYDTKLITSADSFRTLYLKGDNLIVNYTYNSVPRRREHNLATDTWGIETEGYDTTGTKLSETIDYSGYTITGGYQFGGGSGDYDIFPMIKFTSKY